MTTKRLLAIWLGLIIWSPVLAAGDHGGSVEDAVRDIMKTQAVSGQEQIDCEAVTEDEWEKLGDAAMGEMIGNNERHEMMDNMMGGEGSDSLRAMHINMGQRNLNCANDSSGTSSMGMMGGGMGMMGNMMGGGMGQAGGVIGNLVGGIGTMGSGIGGILVLAVLVIVIIGLFIAWLNRKQSTMTSGKTALDILKKRYAKGEIDKQEFETKKRDLLT